MPVNSAVSDALAKSAGPTVAVYLPRKHEIQLK